MEQPTTPHRGCFLMPGEQAEDFPLVLDRCSGPVIRDRFASTGGGDPMLSSSVKTSVILIAAAAFLAGCVSSGGPRDSGGKRMQPSEWKDAPITDILINLADLGDISDATLRGRVKGSSIVQQRGHFGYKKPRFSIEHNYGVYPYSTTEKFFSEEYFRYAENKTAQRSQDTITIEKIDQIRKRGQYAGFIGVSKVENTGRICTVGRLVFLSSGKSHSFSDERFDTYVRIIDCTGRWTFDEMKTWLQGVKILPKG